MSKGEVYLFPFDGREFVFTLTPMAGLCSAVIMSDFGVWDEDYEDIKEYGLADDYILSTKTWEELYDELWEQVCSENPRYKGNMIIFSDCVPEYMDDYANVRGDGAVNENMVLSKVAAHLGANTILKYTSSTTGNPIEVYAKEVD